MKRPVKTNGDFLDSNGFNGIRKTILDTVSLQIIDGIKKKGPGGEKP